MKSICGEPSVSFMIKYEILSTLNAVFHACSLPLNFFKDKWYQRISIAINRTPKYIMFRFH